MAKNLHLGKLRRLASLMPATQRLDYLWNLLRRWHERRQSRRLLATLPPYLLKDLGIDEATRHEELRKPFWRE